MEIRFTSTLAPEDEDELAPVLLKAIVAVLEQCSLAYTLRIETTAHTSYQHHHPPAILTVVAQPVEDDTTNANGRRIVRIPQC